MTLKQLQRYLETEKWRETAKRGYDLCGAYARCAHCNRYDEYPCAEAHNRYVTSHETEAEGLLPEPSVKRVFGTEIAEDFERNLPKQEQPEQKADERASEEKEKPSVKIPIQRLVREKTREQTEPVPIAHFTKEPEAEPAPKEEIAVTRSAVVTRRAERSEKTRLLVLRRK